MSTAPDKNWLRIVAWVIGIGVVLLVLGYLTSDQWLSLVRGLLGGAA